MFWIIALFIASIVISYALTPRPQATKPPGLNEITAPTAEVGREIPVLFGTRDLGGSNVVWYGDILLTPIKSKGGKK